MSGLDSGAGRAKKRGLATLSAVAAQAGVSTATADRVVNRRPGVRPATARRVLLAAAELGYVTETGGAEPRDAKPFRLVFLLPAGSNRFIALLGRLAVQSDAIAARLGIRPRVEFVESFNPDLLARQLALQGKSADGIAFMAIEHPAVREAVDGLAERGVPTATLISDLAHSRRAAYLGLDNRAAGRTAAALLSRFVALRPGTVAMIAGSRSYRAHEEREMGFLHFFEEAVPGLTVTGLREGLDDEARNYRHTRTLLGRHPDLQGIYNIGGAPEGVARALKDVARERHVVFIGHGLTPSTRTLLVDGTLDAVITQSPQHTIGACATVFDNLRSGRDPMSGIERPSTDIILRENLP